MKSLITAAMLIILVIAVYVATIGANGGMMKTLPDKGERISQTVESIDP